MRGQEPERTVRIQLLGYPTLRGRNRVARTLIKGIRQASAGLPGVSLRPVEVNSGPGALILDGQQRLIGYPRKISGARAAPERPVGTIVETNLSLRDFRQNLIVKKVSSWAAIIAVPALITGYHGMNVPYPGFGDWVACSPQPA